MNLLLAQIKFDKSFDFAYIFKSIVTRWYLYVGLVVVMLLVAIFFYKVHQPNRNNLSRTQKIAYMAMFSALGMAVNILQIPFPLVQISFVSLVAFFAGVMIGPVQGFAAAFIGDLIAGIIAPTGVYTPIIGLATALFGFVPGVIFAYGKGKVTFKAILSFGITFIISNTLLNTIGLCMLYSPAILLEKILLLPLNLLFHALNCVLAIIILKRLKKTALANHFKLD